MSDTNNKRLRKREFIFVDTVTRGALAGLAVSVPFGALSWLLFVLGFLPSTPFHYNAVFIMPPGTAITALPLLLGTGG